MIEFRTLGTLDLLDRTDGHQVLSVLAQPKRVGFLTYLVIASPRGLHQRDTLLGIFWPDSTDKKARNALNQSVFVLRRALGQELFVINGEPGVSVDPDRLWCDVWAFEAALASGEKEEALDLYRGNFLEGFFLPGCLEFERWVDSERSRLRDLATGAVLSLSRDMESAGNPVGAVGWLRRAREWAVYDEVVLIRQVELLLALGDRSGAVREYEAFSRRLSVDLGLEPSEEPRNLIQRAPAVVRTLKGAGAPEEVSRGPLPSTLRPIPQNGRWFSLPQTAAIACLAAVVGVGAALSAPRLWTESTSTAASVSEPTDVGKRVAVLPLENATGDQTLDPLGRTAADQIMQELATTGLASVGPVVNPDEASDESGDRAASRGLAGNSLWTLKDADYVVTGSYSERNGRLVYQARVLELGSGSIAVAVDTVVGSLSEPAEATERFKRRVVVALAMVLDPWLSDLAQVVSHPPSLEAYQIVATGLEFLNRQYPNVFGEVRTARGDSVGKIFLRAAAFDSEFTLPLILTLGATRTYDDTVLQILRPLQDELPRWERAMLDFHLAGRAWDHAGQYQAMSRVVSMSPNPEWRYRLARAAIRTNRPREAVELLTPLESERDWLKGTPYFWVLLGDANLLLGDYEAALRAASLGQALLNEHPGLFLLEVEALARLGRVEEAVDRSIEILESSGQGSTRFLRYSLPRVFRAVGLEEPTRRVAEVGLASFTRTEGNSPANIAATLVLAGRYDEAREVLTRPEALQTRRMAAFQLLAYMAAREGDAEEANRLSIMAATAGDPNGVERDPTGIMSQVEAAAHLGDNAKAVRFLREAYDMGLAHGLWLFQNYDLRPLYGYKPFEDLMRPKG